MSENHPYKLDLLDAALQAYGEVEPPAALEARVLGKLDQTLRRRRWNIWLPLAGVATATAVVVLLLTSVQRSPVREQSREQPIAVERPIATTGPPAVDNVLDTGQQQVKPRRQAAPPVAAPRLETFPAPSALSDQEQILISLMRSRRSVLVAMSQPQTL